VILEDGRVAAVRYLDDGVGLVPEDRVRPPWAVSCARPHCDELSDLLSRGEIFLCRLHASA
jgi:hypothetical protein